MLALVTAFWSGVMNTPLVYAATPQYTIMQIQGSGARSPVQNTTVMTTGVVYDVANNGFWMQDPNGDGDPATSDGIFVVTSSTPKVQKGDLVSVTGFVGETATANDPAAAPETQLVGPTISVISSANPLPLPVTISAADTDPAGGINQLEKYEGMRVHVDTLNVIAPTGGVLNEATASSTSDGAFYGVIPNLPRAFRGAGVELPSTPPSPPCCIPTWNGAPQRIRVDTKTLSVPLDLGTGTVVSDLTGPLSFAQHTYTIVTETTPTVVTPGLSNAAAAPAPTSGEFTVATLHLQHFFDTIDDPGSDVALTLAAYNGRLNKASLMVRTQLRTPDIIAVQEVEKLSVLQTLANKINNDAVAAGAANPGYTPYLIPGNDPVLNLGFLVSSRVTVNSVNQYGKTDVYPLPSGGSAILNDYPPLVLDATVTNEHETGRFIVINVQQLSLSGIDNFVDGGRVRRKRKMQADFVANLMHSFQAADSQAKIVVAGDVNGFAVNDGYVDVLGALLGSPAPSTQVVLANSDLVDPNFANLETLLTADQRYTVAEKGTAESLDYILASQGMMTLLSRVAIERANVDFPEVYRNDFNRPERISNHDPLVGYFNLPIDRTPPVLTLPSDFSVEATSTSGAVVTFNASAQDSNDGVVSVTCTPASESTFPVGTTTVSCSAQDARLNTATGSFKVTVKDTTAPVLTLPSDFTAEATSPGGSTVNFAATAQDLVDGPVAVQCAPSSGSKFALGTTAVSCSATDAHSNTASGAFQITVVDTTAPALKLPSDFSVEATNATGALVTYAATAADAVDGTASVLCNPASGTTFALGTTTVSCTSQDAHNNVSNGSFHVTVADTTPPALTLPSDINVAATSANGNVVAFTASALDAVDGTVVVTCSPSSGSTFVIGTTTVSCTAQDAEHNMAKGSFSVSVTDTTPPVLTLASDLSASATSAAGALVTFTTTAVDDIDGPVAVSCSPASGNTFPIGTTTVSCTAQDTHHNVANGEFHVTVSDTAPPVLTLPADISVQATSATGAVVNYSATASDVVDGPIAPLCSPASGNTFPIGTTTVSCTAQDAHHNAINGEFHVTVSDNTPPALTLPADISVQATSISGAVVTYSATAVDLIDGAIAPSCVPVSGSTFPIGTTMVSCTAQDAHHNVASGQFRVTVNTAATPPLVKVTGVVDGANYTLGAVPAAACSTTATSSPVAVNASLSLTGGTANRVGTFTATCSGAKDVMGNVAPPVSATYTVLYAWTGFVGLNWTDHQAGSTIPLIWALGDARWNIVGDPSSVRSLTIAGNSSCSGLPDGTPFPAAAPGDSQLVFFYGIFQFNWKTTGLTAGCYSILLALDDGTTRSAIVMLKSNDDLAYAKRAAAKNKPPEVNPKNDHDRDNHDWSFVERHEDKPKQESKPAAPSKPGKK